MQFNCNLLFGVFSSFLSFLTVFQGFCNQMSYISVNSLSQQIVESFDADNLLGLVVWFNAGFTFITRVVHSAFMLRIPVPIRICIAAMLHLFGDVGLAMSTYVHIALAFVCIVLIGSGAFMGERFLAFFLNSFYLYAPCFLLVSLWGIWLAFLLKTSVHFPQV